MDEISGTDVSDATDGTPPETGGAAIATGTAPVQSQEVVTAPATIARPERTFTQKELDSHIESRLAREREGHQRNYATLQALYDQELAKLREANASGAAPAEKDAIAARIDQIEEHVQKQQLMEELGKMGEKYPDWKPNQAEILQTIVKLNLQNHPQALELGYKAWKYEHVANFNVDEFKKSTIAEYMKEKGLDRDAAPEPEGADGGSAPVAANKHDGSWDYGDRAAAARLKRARENGS